MFRSACGVVGLVALACVLVSCGTKGGGDGEKPSPSVRPAVNEKVRFYFTPIRSLPLAYRIDSVQPDGSVWGSIWIPEREADEIARTGRSAGTFSSLTEGYLFGLTGLPATGQFERMILDISRNSLEFEGVSAIRVQVMEVQEGGKATFRVGPQAVSRLRMGDVMVLMRPPGSSTAQLQAMPDIVAITDVRREVLGMSPGMAAQLAQSKNNLKQIGLAMHNFHDTYGRFPPAVIYGPDGKPWHSWRVLLLPFLDEVALYDQYRFDEPWDGPNNRSLLEKVPPCYQDPIYGETEDALTHYAVAVGEGAGFWPNGYRLPEDESEESRRGADWYRGGRRLSEFQDGTFNTLLAGSVSPERKIPWMKPEDVVFDEQFPGLGKEGGFAAPYQTDNASGGVFVWADVSATTICADIEMQVLRNLIQIDDGQRIPKIPTLEPSRFSRQGQIAVLEIQRSPDGPTARLVIEPVMPEEQTPRVEPAVPQGEAGRKASSADNLKLLGVALHKYQNRYGTFPPAYSSNEDGKPLLSWRVLVLPFADHEALYEQFRLDEPWNSEHNKKLIPKMPAAFRSHNSKAEPGKTNYLGASGPQSMFPGQEEIGTRDVTDGTSNTIMLVEACDKSAVVWTKPDDFVPDAKDPKKGLLGLWKGGFHVGLADGSVWFLNETIDDETLRGLSTRNGGEPIDGTRVGTEGR